MLINGVRADLVQHQPAQPAADPIAIRPVAQGVGAPLENKKVKTLDALLKEELEKANKESSEYMKQSLLSLLGAALSVGLLFAFVIFVPLVPILAIIPAAMLLKCVMLAGSACGASEACAERARFLEGFMKNPEIQKLKDLTVKDEWSTLNQISEIQYLERLIDLEKQDNLDTLYNEDKLKSEMKSFIKMIQNKGAA